jgi:hypothetical protein
VFLAHRIEVLPEPPLGGLARPRRVVVACEVVELLAPVPPRGAVLRHHLEPFGVVGGPHVAGHVAELQRQVPGERRRVRIPALGLLDRVGERAPPELEIGADVGIGEGPHAQLSPDRQRELVGRA